LTLLACVLLIASQNGTSTKCRGTLSYLGNRDRVLETADKHKTILKIHLSVKSSQVKLSSAISLAQSPEASVINN
jgi:hypothetical protein